MVPSETRDRDRVHLIPLGPTPAVSSTENDGRRVPARQLIPEDRDYSTKAPPCYQRSDDRPVDWRAR